ncbi:MAG: PQQ-dependent sugar dehydrogenase [Pseudomonadota bacterium]
MKRIVLWVGGIGLALALGLGGFIALYGVQTLFNPGPQRAALKAADAGLRVVTVARGLEHPWSLAFLPGGRMLVTERAGRLRIVGADGWLSPPLTGVPDVAAKGQGGLMDVALAPDFSATRRIYFAYAEADAENPKHAGTVVAHARLGVSGLEDVTVIFRQTPKAKGWGHFGARLVFADDGTLFITLGERFHHKAQAQNLENSLGKIIRVTAAGAAPADNPFIDKPGALPEIYSYGHRNVQGAALHPLSRRLWVHEHGARGGDELNIIDPGHNYGWPVITWGRDYSGLPIGEGTHKPGMGQPIHYWTPSIAPSGMAFVTADRYPGWRGSLIIGSLAHKRLVRLSLDGERVVGEEHLLAEMGERIRDVRQGPDGLIYLLTDSATGRILRLEPRED